MRRKAEFGARIFWGVLGDPVATDKFRIAAPPVTGNDLPHSTFTHRKKFRFDFDGDSGIRQGGTAQGSDRAVFL
jgi:hypothetical protein